jgi:arsenite oxidase large subunit
MAYKRNVDRLPIPPKDAQVHNLVCHYCIVGCGYHALSWPVDRQAVCGRIRTPSART